MYFPIAKNGEYREQYICAHQQGQDLYVKVHLWNKYAEVPSLGL